jgi:hypothetical protein
MASYNKFEAFTEHVLEKVHDLDLDTLRVYLTNNTPNTATHAVKADLVESVSNGNGYTGGGHDAQLSTSRSGGTTSVSGVDIVITASGGSIGPFRYAVLYNDTPVAPADPLISYWDYGQSISVAAGETFTIDFSPVIFTLT